MIGIRIQKVLADAGISSRRQAEEMILQGRVEVNGHLVTALPCFVDPQADRICVDGQPIRMPSGPKQAYLLNKPKGVLAGLAGQKGPGPHVLDLAPPIRPPVYVVGALDADSTGLVVLTNDGELADRLNHPRYRQERTYVAEVDARVDEATIEALRSPMWLDDRRVEGARLVKVLRRGGDGTLLEIHIVEAMSRQVQRMLAKVRHKVRRLRRVGLGPLREKGLKIGHFRPLSPTEIARIKQAAQGGGQGGGQAADGAPGKRLGRARSSRRRRPG